MRARLQQIPTTESLGLVRSHACQALQCIGIDKDKREASRVGVYYKPARRGLCGFLPEIPTARLACTHELEA